MASCRQLKKCRSAARASLCSVVETPGSKHRLARAQTSLIDSSLCDGRASAAREVGESFEDCVAREVKEEVGVRALSVEYVSSQPWPFPRSFMGGFLATADPTEPIVIDEEEMLGAAWFSRADVERAAALPSSLNAAENAKAGDAPLFVPPKGTLARTLIDTWLDRAAPSPASS